MNISITDGLPSSETYYVYQDRSGNVWFCTDHGVVRYNGFKLHVYNKSNGLPDEVVFKIQEDDRGRVWFYLYNGRLAYYDPQKKRVFPYKYNHLLVKLNHGDFNHRKSFSIDKDDNVYYSGIYATARIDKTGKLFPYKAKLVRELHEVGNDWLLTALQDSAGYLLKEIDIVPQKGKPIRFKYHSGLTQFDMIRINNKRFMCIDGNVYDISNPSNKGVFSGFTGFHLIKGEFWITTLTGAYQFKNPEKATLNKPDGIYLKDQKVTGVAKDLEGGYWFSTLDKGIYYTPCLEIVNWIPEDKESKGHIHNINGIGNQVYYSSAFGYYNLKTGEELFAVKGAWNVIGIWKNQLVLSNNIPYFLSNTVVKRKWGYEMSQFQAWTNDREGNFYAAYVMPVKIHEKTELPEELLTRAQVYNAKKYVAHHFKSLAYDAEEGEVYAGSLIGLFRIRKGEVKKCKLPGDLDHIRITDLKYHPKCGLIAATRGKGILLLKNGKFVASIGEKDGLLSNQLNALFVDKSGIIYAASNEGISKIVLLKNHHVRVFNLTQLNGLVSSEISTVYANKEGVYLGTRKGIALIPSSYNWMKSSREKQISVQAVFANGKKVTDFKKGMEFNSSHKVIRLLLKTTNFKSQHRQPYKYRFRKTDPWSVGYNGELIMINPAFETYDLEIKYQNEYGSWSNSYSLTRFSVLPPFYSTWWFTALIVLAVLIISFLVFRYRLKVIQRRNEIQRNMEILEQKALLAQMNPHFIFNALNSIQSFLLYNENELAERYLLKLSKLIRLTLTNSRETEISIQKEIDSLQMYLELEQMRFKNRFEFRVEISLSKEELNKFVPPMLIQPFAENAIIHGFKGLEQGGLINLNFKNVENNRLIVEIIDNGVGYNKHKPNTQNPEHKSYATQITSERLKLFQERYQSEFDFTIEGLKDEHGNPKGTKVVISIPIFNKD
ncbi:histidine kinase [Fluviicola sp.]|uniref:sensor histidine kinase n=1 Tax=Fluviicola sp. TaxID=1917219 RepID=UPI0031D55721